jgi:hypothetical protein
VDLSTLSIEEREASIKIHNNETPVMRGGRGGAGNIRTGATPPSPGAADDDRGRNAGAGVFGSMLRSLSRATRGDTK